MNIEAELALPEAVRRTRCSKQAVISASRGIIEMAKQLEFRAKNAPETDDMEHAELCEEFEHKVKRAYAFVESAAMFGIE